MRSTQERISRYRPSVERLEERNLLAGDSAPPWELLTQFEPSLATEEINFSKLVTDAQRADKPFQHKQVKPALARDFNPDPNVFETVLVASPETVDLGTGELVDMLTYNGLVPGPLIEAQAGDRLIVHFMNRAGEDTTIHWHGLELPANMDGSNIAQLAVPTGGYFRYEFDLLTPSLFWYHPHLNTNELVERGLHGPLLVHGPGENDLLGVDPKHEHTLVLDDILLDDETGQVAPPYPADPLENALTHLNGRDGNHFLVNGREDLRGLLQRDVPHRMRIVNVSNTRFMRLSIPGHTIWRVGGDGGLLETPITIEPIEQVPDGEGALMSDPDPSKGLLLTPGERADIVFVPTGKEIVLQWHDIARGRHSAFYTADGSIGIGDADDDGKRPVETLMTFKLFGKRGGDYQPPADLRDIEAIDYTDAEKMVYTFGHAPPDAAGEVTFFAQVADGGPKPFPVLTPAQAYSVTVGETRIIEVSNLTGGDHNVHLHGFVMQPIEIEYIDAENPDNNRIVPFEQLENKDTVLIPRRPGGRGTSRAVLRLAVTFDDTGREGQVAAAGKVPTATQSGGWLLHCHILEHSDSGMMSFVQVLADEEAAVGPLDDVVARGDLPTRTSFSSLESKTTKGRGLIVDREKGFIAGDHNPVAPIDHQHIRRLRDLERRSRGRREDVFHGFDGNLIDDDLVTLFASEQNQS